MKPIAARAADSRHSPFSILERIDVGETLFRETVERDGMRSFSILERIDVGETLENLARAIDAMLHFQYPRTDRRG